MIRRFKEIKIKGCFEGNQNFAFTKNHELYYSTMDMEALMNKGIIREKIEKYDSSGNFLKQLNLDEMYNDLSMFYNNLEGDPNEFESIQNLFSIGDQLIVSTVNNRNYIFENDTLKFVYGHNGKKLEIKKREDIFAQTQNLASSFFQANDNRLYFLTNGTDKGRTNERDRYIVGLSNDRILRFEQEAFLSTFCIDLWDRTDKVPPLNMKVQNYIAGKLERSIELTFPRIFQVVDLNEEYFLISIFSDNLSKAATPDKNTPYYFLKIEKKTGNVARNIAPKDMSVYKGSAHYRIIKDSENELLQFKTNDYLHLIKYSGVIQDSINLKTEKLSKLRNLVLLNKVDNITYFFNISSSEVIGIELGNTKDEIINNYKSYSKSI
ncbi:MAG: hypothetical protein MK105_16345 [Crocinitomicaceae bacterium]|nr:hypothetical protein [Crocinitomicaceae bacterium]